MKTIFSIAKQNNRREILFSLLTSTFSLLLLLYPGIIRAQDSAQLELTARPAQVSFFYPLGTNGKSREYVHKFSLNVLVGYNGGVDGAELGLLFNGNMADVNGFQISGLVNLTGGNSRGLQLSGVSNTNGGNLNGWQATGIANLVKGYADGVQISGLANISRDYAKGAQLTGFANVSGSWMNGAQVAGFCNIVAGDVSGFQGAGFLNTSKNAVGAQMAGFVNIVDGSGNGFQMAGFSNINNYDFKGAQISAFLNVARKVDGFQLALINVCDSIDGVPLGLINVVSHGYRKFDLWFGESFYANAGFKMGVRQLYTSYIVGVQPFGKSFRWGVGLGLGSEFDLNEKTYMDLDLMGYHVNEGRTWTNELNLLTQLKFSFGLRFSEQFSGFFGPTINLTVSQYINPETGTIGSDMAPYTLYNRTSNGTNYKMWIGGNIGFKF